MEISSMGKVLVTARIESLKDFYEVELGVLPADEARFVEVFDALVDTGAMMLSLPTRLIDQLGLERYRTRRLRTVGGVIDCNICEAVRLTIQGRDFTSDVAEIPDECPVLIGQIPLEGLDFVVDPSAQKLIGNPEHGGEHMIDCFKT
jgi:predicted aspartyl protease